MRLKNQQQPIDGPADPLRRVDGTSPARSAVRSRSTVSGKLKAADRKADNANQDIVDLLAADKLGARCFSLGRLEPVGLEGASSGRRRRGCLRGRRRNEDRAHAGYDLVCFLPGGNICQDGAENLSGQLDRPGSEVS